jgi:beta-glucosidase
MKLQLAGAKSVMISSGEITELLFTLVNIITDVLKKNRISRCCCYRLERLSISIRDTKWPKPIEMPFELLSWLELMSMVPENYSFCTDLLDLVIKGEVPMSRIDDAVSRI